MISAGVRSSSLAIKRCLGSGDVRRPSSQALDREKGEGVSRGQRVSNSARLYKVDDRSFFVSFGEVDEASQNHVAQQGA